MNELEILTKVEAYYEREYNILTKGLKDYSWIKSEPYKYIWQSMSECCAIVMFVQDLGVAFDDINPIYENYYKKFQNLMLTF